MACKSDQSGFKVRKIPFPSISLVLSLTPAINHNRPLPSPSFPHSPTLVVPFMTPLLNTGKRVRQVPVHSRHQRIWGETNRAPGKKINEMGVRQFRSTFVGDVICQFTSFLNYGVCVGWVSRTSCKISCLKRRSLAVLSRHKPSHH